jgi:hypothetical protein
VHLLRSMKCRDLSPPLGCCQVLACNAAASRVQVEGADGRTQIEQAGGCGGFGKGNFTALFKSIEVMTVMRIVVLRLD